MRLGDIPYSQAERAKQEQWKVILWLQDEGNDRRIKQS